MIGNHWVLAGKDERGHAFFYDPYPDSRYPQLVTNGENEEFWWYMDKAKKFGTGPAPRTDAEVESGRRRFGPR